VSAAATALQPELLVVEDDHDARVLLRELLESAGYHVTTTANGRDALRRLREAAELPALILVDLRMPMMDGWELLDALRADPVWAQLPVVVQTGDSSRPLPRGVRLALRKPINADALLDAVARYAPVARTA
jgi:CheY-like chemotaxis protein